jgi:ribosome-binding protein aMBF1 (putative translation factor)
MAGVVRAVLFHLFGVLKDPRLSHAKPSFRELAAAASPVPVGPNGTRQRDTDEASIRVFPYKASKNLECYGNFRTIEKIMQFSEQLKRLREAKGLSQNGLAKESGIPAGTIRDYEQGRIAPSLAKAHQLAITLGVSLDELVRHEEAKQAKPKGKRGK